MQNCGEQGSDCIRSDMIKKQLLSDEKVGLKERIFMAITVNIYYKGEKGNARKFAEEMISTGTVDEIRKERGNLRYEYFFPMNDSERVLLIDSWENQQALDIHHKSPMMAKILELREKYELHMEVERYISDELPDKDKAYIKE